MSSPSLDEAKQARIRESFGKQELLASFGATLGDLGPGTVEIIFPVSDLVLQQHGFVHGGAIGATADSASGLAALTLMPPGSGVLTTEYKINFVAPAAGDRIIVCARIVKAGRTLTLTLAEIFAESAGVRKLIALMTATMMTIENRDGIEG